MNLQKKLADDQSGASPLEKPRDVPFSSAALTVVGRLCSSGRYRGDSMGAWLAWHNGRIITSAEEDKLLTPEQIAKKYPWLAYIYLPSDK